MVVRRKRRGSREAGRYESMRSWTSASVDVDGRGMESVRGRSRPGKVVRRMLVVAAMTALSNGGWCGGCSECL